MKMLKVSTRGQVSLGSLAQYDLYIARVDDRGVITLQPAKVQPLKEGPK